VIPAVYAARPRQRLGWAAKIMAAKKKKSLTVKSDENKIANT